MSNNLPFRPLDNSSSTRMRYNLEAEHWENAYRSNRVSSRATNITQIGGLISTSITILTAVFAIIFTIVFWLVKRIFK